MTKAFAYLRVSGKSQLDGDGFPRQRAAIQAYADAHDIEIVEFFEERAVSGTREWEGRPAWSDMIGRLNGVKTIIVERLDRLSREYFLQEYILRDLKKREVELLSAQDGEETADDQPTRKLVRQLLGAIAEYDKTMIVHKLRAARNRQKAATGRCEGQKPYGTQVGESDVLGRIAQMRGWGWTYDRIALQLNDQGVPTRHGKTWYGCTVSKILAAQK